MPRRTRYTGLMDSLSQPQTSIPTIDPEVEMPIQDQPMMTPIQGTMNVPASKLPVFREPKDFRSSLHWRVFRIIAEFIDGWQFLADFPKTVTFFGSARFEPGNRWYEEAHK